MHSLSEEGDPNSSFFIEEWDRLLFTTIISITHLFARSVLSAPSKRLQSYYAIAPGALDMGDYQAYHRRCNWR
jgi:hypothetical protein